MNLNTTNKTEINSTQNKLSNNRRYDVDWIRVLAFDLLILFHVTLIFVPSWGWIIKNNELVSWTRYFAVFSNYWRIPILFFVSGIGTRFAISNKTKTTYIKERITRLLLPLIIGILIVIPPQIYYQKISQGVTFNNFLDFYTYFFKNIYQYGSLSAWLHLWFLPYLLVMTIIATPLFFHLKKENNLFINKLTHFINKTPFIIYTLVIPTLIIEILFSRKFPANLMLYKDWYALSFYFIFFISGYILTCTKNSFWNATVKIRHITLILGIITYLISVTLNMNFEFFSIVKVITIWSWIFTIFGFAGKYLNNESKIIKYRNKAVYPFYIFHETIIVICGYYLVELPIHYALKMIILITVTFTTCWIIYEFIILKFPAIQPLFGVKRDKN